MSYAFIGFGKIGQAIAKETLIYPSPRHQPAATVR
jgi:pyrroline-5-carboxylate reductase